MSTIAPFNHSEHFMALRSTIHKAELHIADSDRGYYASHVVTVARHPSETDERMMTRLLAFALHATADDDLAFTRGLSESDEPDLWRRDLTGHIVQWIETGLPDDRRILKACGRADDVIVLAYGRNVSILWHGVRDKVARARKLRVYSLSQEGTAALAGLAERSMTLHINVQDEIAYVSSDAGMATVAVQRLR